MNEENEKMKRDWQDEGGKVNERLETWSVNNKSIIDGSEFTTNISESFNLANKVSTVAWPPCGDLISSMIQKDESTATQGQGGCNQEDKTLPGEG